MRRAHVLLAAILILLSGCITFDIDQTIRSDATTSVTIRQNLSAMQQMNQGMLGDQNNSQGALTINTSINNQTQDAPNLCADVEASWSCTTIDDYVIEMSKVFELTEQELEIQQTLIEETYKYDLRTVMRFLENSSSEDLDMSNLEMMGAELTYTVSLPAPVLQAPSYAEIDENAVTVDVYDISQSSRQEVVATQSTVFGQYLIPISAGALVIIVLILSIVLYKRHQHKQVLRQDPKDVLEPINPQEKQYRDYINQYKTNYSKESLKQVLLQAGLTETQADKYLNKYY